MINKLVSDGNWHHVAWTRRFKRITLTLDETFTAQADLPGANSEFSVAQRPVVRVDIGRFPPGVSQAKGKVIQGGVQNISKSRLKGFCFTVCSNLLLFSFVSLILVVNFYYRSYKSQSFQRMFEGHKIQLA